VVWGAAIVGGCNRIEVAISKCAAQSLTENERGGVRAMQLSQKSKEQLEARFRSERRQQGAPPNVVFGLWRGRSVEK
jgi:hypothetical protein